MSSSPGRLRRHSTNPFPAHRHRFYRGSPVGPGILRVGAMAKHMTQEQIAAILIDAKRTNASRDADERRNGFEVLSDASHDEQLRTILQAIVAGIGTGGWPVIAEAWAMLESLMTRMGIRHIDNSNPAGIQ